MALLLVKSTQNTSQRELISSILTHFALTHKNGESLILSSLKHSYFESCLAQWEISTRESNEFKLKGHVAKK